MSETARISQDPLAKHSGVDYHLVARARLVARKHLQITTTTEMLADSQKLVDKIVSYSLEAIPRLTRDTNTALAKTPKLMKPTGVQFKNSGEMTS